MREALFYEKNEDKTVRCGLCPHGCTISPGKRGLCGVRENREGTLFSLSYGRVIAEHVDPIEKKPLYHFYPGTRSYSIATTGCNLRCLHCQNSTISQHPKTHSDIPGNVREPGGIVSDALRTGCNSISYTYTEPTIFLEFALDCARLARERGLKNVFVSNGYMSRSAAQEIIPFLDANNIDLKGDDRFYREITGARLQPVLDTIRLMKESGVWVEVTTLIIPGLNDSETFLRWAAEFICSVDTAIPWHVTQFYPTYRMTDRPRTPVPTLRRAREIGIDAGLKFVYEGNITGQGGENTICPSCGRLLIERVGYMIGAKNTRNSRCSNCGTLIEGVGMP